MVVSTEAAHHVTSDLKRRKINKHLCHSDQTSEHYYEFTNVKDAIEAHHEIQKLAKKRKLHDKKL